MLGVSASENEGATFRLKPWLTVPLWLAMPVVVGAVLLGLTMLRLLQAANQLYVKLASPTVPLWVAFRMMVGLSV